MSAKDSVQQPEQVAVLLENEDEFEEFEVDEWDSSQQQLEEELWEHEWDDDTVGNDDFSQRLKAELNSAMS
jgi:26 proteasome complex subunit DSS1